MLVIEDIHWATPPTLAMLTHLVRSGEPGRLLIVVNYRDTALDITPALADAVADLLRQPDVDRVRLGGLDPAGVAAYVEAVAGHDLDAGGRRVRRRPPRRDGRATPSISARCCATSARPGR